MHAYPHKCDKHETFASLSYYFEVNSLLGSYGEVFYKVEFEVELSLCKIEPCAQLAYI
jgi:hypothetical protein